MITINRKRASTLTDYALPTCNCLSPGKYVSILHEIRNVEQQNITSKKEIVGLDCYHELTDSTGKILKMRFRYYASSYQVEEVAQVLEHYGFEGKIGDVKDLKENVILSRSGENSDYLYISAREYVEVE